MATTGSMTILRQGLKQASAKWGVLGLLYAFNLLITLPLALAFRSALSAIGGESPAIDQLFPDFLYTIYADLTRVHADAFAVFRRMFIPVMVVSVPMHAILGVGLARVMESDGSVREFLAGISAFGWRAIRLLLITFLVGFVLFVVAAFFGTIIFAGVTDGNATEDAYLLGGLVFGLLIGIVLAITILGAEYARILTVREDRSSMFRTTWDGFMVVLRHPIRMAALHGSILITLAAAALLYWLIDGVIGMTTVIGVILMFLVQQLFIVYRLLTRMWNTSNGVKFAGILATATRPSFVKAPSVHDRRRSYREPPAKESDGSVGQESKGSRSGSDRSGRQGQGNRSGYRRRGRGRGPGGGQKPGGASGRSPGEKKAPPKPGAKPPSSEGTSKPGGPPKSGKPRRRRRPPRRPSGNA